MPITDNQQFLIEYCYYQDPNGVLTPLFGAQKTLLSWEGVGLPPIDYLSDKGPGQHGRTIRDFRFRQRQITLELYEKGCLRSDFWTAHYNLIDAIRPNRSSTNATGYILIINEDGLEREIPARIISGPAGDWLGMGSQIPSDLNEKLTFICPDPFWRDPTQNSETFTLNPTSTCLPTCLPTCLGGLGIINTTTTITYTGTWQGDQIDIEITGPLNNPIITNDTTSKSIKLNYNIANGEKVTISIRPELTTVTNNSGQNLIGTVEDIADLVDFNLVTAGDLTSTGANNITVYGTGGTDGQTSVIFKYYTRDITLYGGS